MAPAEQEVVRRQALRLRTQGKTQGEIADILGISLSSVGRWCKAFKEHGAAAIKSRKQGEKRHLSPDQEREIQQCLVEKQPDQFKLTFALWTRQAVCELIHHLYGFRMPIRTVGEYLKRWGFTPQKPLKRAYEQRPEDVERWLEEEYPTIARRAKDEGAEIHWGDETGLRSDSQHGRSYSPKGKTPAISISARRTSVNMISSVNNQGKLRFMLVKGTMNAQKLIGFMKRLCRDAGRKVFLILDNLRVHHAKIVRAWLEEHRDEIEVFYLPSYSPELNPDEYLNNDLKAAVHSRPPVRDQHKFERVVLGRMRMLQKSPSRIANYFKHRSVTYAA